MLLIRPAQHLSHLSPFKLSAEAGNHWQPLKRHVRNVAQPTLQNFTANGSSLTGTADLLSSLKCEQ